MKYLILSIFLVGCSVVATQSDDGKILTIHGSGSAKFENGAEIVSEPIIKIPEIKWEDD